MLQARVNNTRLIINTNTFSKLFLLLVTGWGLISYFYPQNSLRNLSKQCHVDGFHAERGQHSERRNQRHVRVSAAVQRLHHSLCRRGSWDYCYAAFPLTVPTAWSSSQSHTKRHGKASDVIFNATHSRSVDRGGRPDASICQRGAEALHPLTQPRLA